MNDAARGFAPKRREVAHAQYNKFRLTRRENSNETVSLQNGENKFRTKCNFYVETKETFMYVYETPGERGIVFRTYLVCGETVFTRG